MKILVVTGGIGSGKSEVCRIISEVFGYPVYNADNRVKRLYDTDADLLPSIERTLGETFRNKDGVFSASLLSSRICGDSGSLEIVESLVFPALMKDFSSWCEDADSEVAVFESATVLEKEQFKGFGDHVLLVDAPVRLRLERACGRDGVEKEKVQARMGMQKLMNMYSEGTAIPEVDAVIINDGDLKELRDKVVLAIHALFDGNK